MDDYLYDNVIDGLIHISVLFFPLALTVISQIANGATDALLISLVFSVVSSLYSAVKKYNDYSFYRIRRIRISLLIIIIALSVSLCYTIIILLVHYYFKNGYGCFLLDYSLPYSIFVLSNIPYVFEFIIIVFDDVTKGDISPVEADKNKHNYDLRSANVN